MSQSKDAQVKDVVVGLALGTLACGVTAVTSNKATLESAARKAWTQWDGSSKYPSIVGFSSGNLIWMGIQRSARRRATVAAWATDRWVTPYLLQPWTVAEALEHMVNESPTANWRSLGASFIAGFHPDEILREER